MTHAHKLKPNEALSAAGSIYRLKTISSLDKTFEPSKVYNLFDFTKSSNKFSAKSGIFEFKQKAGFAAMAMGKDKYENHAILVCRGTDGAKDWLSDLNIGAQVSLSGHMVHAGINRIYNQFRDDILRFVDSNKARTIHCVGHSLGGALANLVADTLVGHDRKSILYTFGAPRVGVESLANKLSRHPRLGVKNIFRVYHSSDPVSMIPFFPFVHAPQPGGEYYLNKYLTINPWDHKMAAYTRSLIAVDSWEQIHNPHPSIDAHAAKWMQSSDTWRYCGLNSYNLAMAMKAIQLLVKPRIRSWTS